MNMPGQSGVPVPITHVPVLAPLPREKPGHHDCALMRGRRDELRARLERLKERAAGAASWLETARQFAKLINADGFVPVTARLSRDDLEFLGTARTDVLAFADLGLCLLDMHQPVDAGGISSDPSSPVRRCGSCMRLWPCPTFRAFAEVFGEA